MEWEEGLSRIFFFMNIYVAHKFRLGKEKSEFRAFTQISWSKVKIAHTKP